MCSSPIPKRRVKARIANTSVGILSSMSSEKRLLFADCANQASERRIKAKQLKSEAQNRINTFPLIKRHPKNNKAKTNVDQSWLYWLLNTSLSELMRKLIS
jgi:hypothetical protein